MAITFWVGLLLIGYFTIQANAGCSKFTIPPSGHLNIPSDWTTIPDSAFLECKKLKSITIPETVTSIGKQAFTRSGLESIEIPDTVTLMEEGAFKKIWNLKSVRIGGGIKSIPDFAFLQCRNLKSITIPETVTSIGKHAFKETGLDSIEIPDTVTLMEEGAFMEIWNLKSVRVGSGVRRIERETFRYCPRLESVVVSEGVEYLGSQAFADDPSLTSISFPDSLSQTPWSLFQGGPHSSELASMACSIPSTDIDSNGHYDINSSWSYIPSFAFTGCSTLKSVGIPSSVVSIRPYAFYRSTIESVSLGDTVLKIGPSAFDKCTALKSVSIADTTRIAVIPSYTFRECYALEQFDIPASVTVIGEGAFCRCTALKALEIPKQITTLGSHVCFLCSSITSLVIPDSVKGELDYTCTGCTSLRTLTIGAGITAIRRGFGRCRSLQTIIFSPSGALSTIGEYAFSGANLTSLTISSTMRVVGASAFNEAAINTLTIEPNQNLTLAPSAFSTSRLISITTDMLEVGEEDSSGHRSGYLEKYFKWSKTSLERVVLGSSIKKVGAHAFMGAKSLKSVVIGDSVEEIGVKAFSYCSALASVTIPETVTRIDNNSFESCAALSHIGLPEGLTWLGHSAFKSSGLETVSIPSGVTTLHPYAFATCEKLTTVTLSEGLVSIGEYVFSKDSSLQTVSFPSSLREIGRFAFYRTALLEVTIPDGVTTLGVSSFQEIAALQKLTIGAGVTRIPSHAFALSGQVDVSLANRLQVVEWSAFVGCKKLTSIVLPDSVTQLGDNAFGGCTALTSVVIPNSVTQLGDYAFRECTALTSVVIPDSVTQLGDYAFRGCTALTSVVIPDSVTQLGNSVFGGCTNLTSTCLIPSGDIDSFGHYDVPSSWTHIPAFSIVAACSTVKSVGIPASVVSIRPYAFYNSQVEVITLGPEVTRIGAMAFAESSALTALTTINTSVTSIGYRAFYKSKALTDVTLGDSLEDLAGNVFESCRALKSLTFGKAITKIPDSVCSYCSALQTVSFGNVEESAVTSIGANAFSRCTALQGITLPTGLTEIGDSAFYSAFHINYYGHSLTIPANVTRLGSSSFSQCRNLAKVNFAGNNSLEVIGSSAFAYCSYVRVLDLPESVKEIGRGAFSHMDRLKRIHLPESVKIIEIELFQYSYELVEVNVSSQLISVGDRAFLWTKLRSLTLPATVTTIGEAAFRSARNLHNLDLPPDSAIKSIGKWAFEGSRISVFTFPKGTTSIEEGVFGGTRLVEAHIPAVVSIGAEAFAWCKSLTSVTLGQSLSAIGKNAFRECRISTVVTGSDLSALNAQNYIFGAALKDMSPITKLVINAPIVEANQYLTFGNKVETLILGEGVTKVKKDAFACMSTTILDRVGCYRKSEQMAKGALDATGVNILNPNLIPDVDSFPVSARGGSCYSGGKKVSCGLAPMFKCQFTDQIDESGHYQVPVSVTAISAFYFYNCQSLRSVALHEKVRSVQHQAFFKTNLGSIEIPASVKFIGSQAFHDKVNMTRAFIAGDTYVGRSAFEGCTSLTNVSLPSNLTVISEAAFKGCTRVTSLVVPAALRTVGPEALMGCSSLANLSIPSVATTWGKNALEDCGSLQASGVFFSGKVTSVTGFPVALSNLRCTKGRCACIAGYGNALAGDSRLVNCQPCPPGASSTSPPSLECGLCSSGRYNHYSGQTICSACPKGKYGETIGATSGDVCRECAAGFFAPSTGYTKCSMATPGTFCNDTGMAQPHSCPRGRYQSKTRQTSCVSCPRGRYQSEEGSATCELCPSGKFLDAEGSTSIDNCLDCPPGSIGIEDGMSTCTPCGKDTYSASSGGEMCISCPTGKTTEGEGKNGTGIGAIGCVVEKAACLPGQQRDNSTGLCNACEPGSFSSDGAKCQLCPRSSFSDAPGSIRCDLCPAGRYGKKEPSSSSSIEEACDMCAEGTYTGIPGTMGCIDCPPGSFCNSTGLTAYIPCTAGRFSDQSNVKTCNKCQAGTYQPRQGQAVCLSCPWGMQNPNEGEHSLSSCTACPVGTSAANGTATCEPCLPGQYQPDPGQLECLVCTKEYGAKYINNADSTGCVINSDLLSARETLVGTMFEKGPAMSSSFICGLFFAAVAAALYLKREKADEKADGTMVENPWASRGPIIAKSFLPGFSYASEMLLMTGMWDLSPGLAATILFFRLFHLIAGLFVIGGIYLGPVPADVSSRPTTTSSSSDGARRRDLGSIANSMRKSMKKDMVAMSESLDYSFVNGNIPLVGLVTLMVMTDVTMLQFLPWKQSTFVLASKGFPSIRIMRGALMVKIIQATVSVICQIVFLVEHNDVNDPTTSALAKALFALNISSSIIGVVMGLILLCIKNRLFNAIATEAKPRSEQQEEEEEETEAETEANTGAGAGMDMHEEYLSNVDSYDPEAPLGLTDNPLHATTITTTTPSSESDGEVQLGALRGGDVTETDDYEITLDSVYQHKEDAGLTENPLLADRDLQELTGAAKAGASEHQQQEEEFQL